MDREPPADPADWRELAAAYHAHHFNCPTCKAAGRGSQYGLRCGTGAALWTSCTTGAGRLLGVEVKAKAGRLRPEQAVFLERINGAGGLGFMARDCRDVLRELKKGNP